MKPHVRKGRVASLKAKRDERRPRTAPAGGRRSAKPTVARWTGIETVELVNDDWDRVASEMDPGRTLDTALVEHSLEATRDVKRWENALLQAQLVELQGCGVHRWLETTKRGLGLFLCLDSGGRLIVSGVESPSSASKAGVPVGCEVLSINGAAVYPDETGRSAVTGLLSTVCHRRVNLVLSPPEPSALGTAGLRAWQPFPDFEALKTVGEPLVTIEHCYCCKDHQVTTRHDEGKYVAVANELKEAIQDLVPYARIELKAFDLHDPIFRGRLGTMEVQLGWRGIDGALCKRVVFSKRVRGCWPRVWKVAETILTQLKLTPAVVAFSNPQLAAATAIQANVRGHQVRRSATVSDNVNQESMNIKNERDDDEHENEEVDERPTPHPGQAPPPPAAPRDSVADTEDKQQPEPEPEPESERMLTKVDEEPDVVEPPLETITTLPGSTVGTSTTVPQDEELHPERERWKAALGRWVRVNPNCDDEDTVAEMESFSPGGGNCRLCEVLPELEAGLLMLRLERTAVPSAAEEDDNDNEEGSGDLRTDVYPCDVIELVDDDTARVLDARFGNAGEWVARCAEASREKLALTSALYAGKAQGQDGLCPVRIRQQGASSGGLYCTSTVAHDSAFARSSLALDQPPTLIAVADEEDGYDDRPFTVKVSGATFHFAQGEIEMGELEA